jgi:hypothetical protein
MMIDFRKIDPKDCHMVNPTFGTETEGWTVIDDYDYEPRTVCGETDCEGCIIKYAHDIEACKRHAKQETWVITENGCVITCPKCGKRLELCYPDGTEVRYLPHCPWCGKKLEK